MADNWSYNLRTYDALSDDDDGDGNNEALQEPLSNDSEILRQIDLSSRQDNAHYKPNPWSIAKVNAASRSKPSVPAEPVELPVSVKAKPKGAIVDAFRKQAEKSRPKLSQVKHSGADLIQFSPSPQADAQSQSMKFAARYNPSPTVHSSSQNTLKLTENLPTIALFNKMPHPNTSLSLFNERTSPCYHRNQENTHTVTDFTARRGLLAAGTTSPTLFVPPRNQSFTTSLAPHYIRYANTAESDSSHERPFVGRISPVPQASVPLSNRPSETLPHLRCAPILLPGTPLRGFRPPQNTQATLASVDRIFSRAAYKNSGRQVMSSPPALASYSPRRQYMNYRQVRSSPAPDHRGSARGSFAQMQPPPFVQLAHRSPPVPSDETPQDISLSHPRKRKALPPPSMHPPPYIGSPSASPPHQAKAVARKSRQDPYESLLLSPDSQWSTLRPPKKKAPANKRKSLLESGKFRLPSILGGQMKETTVGENKVRVVTYLPPPLKMEDISQVIQENMSDSVSSGRHEKHSDGYLDNTIYDLPPARSGLLSPPPSDDLPSSCIDTPAIEFDTNGVVRRYRVVRQGIRKRKQVRNQLWSILGLESCGVVYKDTPTSAQPSKVHEIAIVSWAPEVEEA